jgi:hypothetical protein
MTFPEFMTSVDRELHKVSGLTHSDLADFAYRAAYDDGEDPADVAEQVLEEEEFPFGCE